MRRNFKSASIACIILSFAVLSAFAATKDAASRLKTLTGQQRAKVVWTKTSITKDADFPPDRSRFSDEILVGFDTNLGIEETLQTTRSNYQNPLITHDGKHVIFTHISAADDTIITSIVDWSKNAVPRVLVGKGMAACLWYDPGTKKDFVVYAAGYGQSSPSGSIRKRNIDDTLSDTLAFKGNGNPPVTEWLRISANGFAFGGCLGNWGQNGENLEVDDKNGNLLVLNNSGCWPSMPYDNTYRFVKTVADHSLWQVKGPDDDDPLEAVTNGWIPDFSQLRMASYIPNIFLLVVNNGDNGTGMIEIVKTDSTLLNLQDTLTFTDDLKTSHHADIWAGPDSAATGIIKSSRSEFGPSMANGATDIIELYSITGRRIGAFRNRENVFQASNLPAGTYLAKSYYGKSVRIVNIVK